MPIRPISQESFAVGEIGPYLSARVTQPVYTRSAKTLENWIVLPQGPIERRRGFKRILELSGVSADAVRASKFSFNANEEYTLLFSPLQVQIVRNETLRATVVTPYSASDVFDLRLVQSGDNLIIVHPNYSPRQLVRNGSDTDWSLATLTFLNVAWNRFNLTSLCTPSATSGAITLTLDNAPGWRAGHASNVRVRINSGVAEITGFTNQASGGTALASAGTASNAYDSNNGTVTNAGTNGWVGYGFATAQTVRLVGVQSNSTQVSTIVFETANNASFTGAVNRGTIDASLVAGTLVWLDVTSPSADTHFRFRVTSGQALDVQEVRLSFGLVANATVITNLTNTTQSNNWQEWGWSPARGFPRSVTFYQNRLIFGGVRDAPATIFGSKTGDFFNFDNSATNADNAFAFTLNTDQVHIIRDIKSKRNLNIFTSDGELELSGSDTALTPTSVKVAPQSTYGISDIPVLEVDDQLHFVTRNFKEVRSFVYQLGSDKYVADNKTILAHHLFKDGKEPFGMAFLRSYKETQSNLLIVSREDGEICVLTTDSQREVVAWSRWTTDGLFRDVIAVNVNINNKLKQALFAVVQRTVNGVNKVFLEMLTEEDAWLDCWHAGTSGTPQTTWSGITSLANSNVMVVADGHVAGTYAVNGSGQFTLPNPASSVIAGREYKSTLGLQFLRVVKDGQALNRVMRLVKTSVTLQDTLSLKIGGQAVPFRGFGNQLLDDPLITYTGTKERKLLGVGKDLTVTLTVEEPLPCTINSVTTEVKIGN